MVGTNLVVSSFNLEQIESGCGQIELGGWGLVQYDRVLLSLLNTGGPDRILSSQVGLPIVLS